MVHTTRVIRPLGSGSLASSPSHIHNHYHCIRLLLHCSPETALDAETAYAAMPGPGAGGTSGGPWLPMTPTTTQGASAGVGGGVGGGVGVGGGAGAGAGQGGAFPMQGSPFPMVSPPTGRDAGAVAGQGGAQGGAGSGAGAAGGERGGFGGGGGS